jgi:membrane-associated phospholipid phosphatase
MKVNPAIGKVRAPPSSFLLSVWVSAVRTGGIRGRRDWLRLARRMACAAVARAAFVGCGRPSVTPSRRGNLETRRFESRGRQQPREMAEFGKFHAGGNIKTHFRARKMR